MNDRYYLIKNDSNDLNYLVIVIYWMLKAALLWGGGKHLHSRLMIRILLVRFYIDSVHHTTGKDEQAASPHMFFPRSMRKYP